jgi:hypothetical protein
MTADWSLVGLHMLGTGPDGAPKCSLSLDCVPLTRSGVILW